MEMSEAPARLTCGIESCTMDTKHICARKELVLSIEKEGVMKSRVAQIALASLMIGFVVGFVLCWEIGMPGGAPLFPSEYKVLWQERGSALVQNVHSNGRPQLIATLTTLPQCYTHEGTLNLFNLFERSDFIKAVSCS